MKNVTIILGSPRIKGNTARLVGAMMSAVDNENTSYLMISAAGRPLLSRLHMRRMGTSMCVKKAR